MKKFVAICSALMLAGCATTPGTPARVWHSSVSTDEFTDKTTKMVTIGAWRSDSLLMTQSLHYYPFVGVQDGELYVGVRSGGSYRIPTGTVQIRVDGNEAWTISPEETPVSLIPEVVNPYASMIPATSEEAKKGQELAMANMTKILSPYTAATGDKAKAMLKQMITGKKVIFRTVGMNQAASSTGEVEIDDSFIDSLKEIGIDPATL